MSCKIARIDSPLSSLITTVYTSGVYTSFVKSFSFAAKCSVASPPYITHGTLSALRRALVEAFPTLSLLVPSIVRAFIINVFKFECKYPLFSVIIKQKHVLIYWHRKKWNEYSELVNYIKNLELIDLFSCTLSITSANRSAQLSTLILSLS